MYRTPQEAQRIDDGVNTLNAFDTILGDTLKFMLERFKANGMTPSLTDMLALEQVMEESLESFDECVDAKDKADGFEGIWPKRLLRDVFDEVFGL